MTYFSLIRLVSVIRNFFFLFIFSSCFNDNLCFGYWDGGETRRISAICQMAKLLFGYKSMIKGKVNILSIITGLRKSKKHSFHFMLIVHYKRIENGNKNLDARNI